jgi:hypothetical protein
VIRFKDDVGCPLAYTDYHTVAQGYGTQWIFPPSVSMFFVTLIMCVIGGAGILVKGGDEGTAAGTKVESSVLFNFSNPVLFLQRSLVHRTLR